MAVLFVALKISLKVLKWSNCGKDKFKLALLDYNCNDDFLRQLYNLYSLIILFLLKEL